MFPPWLMAVIAIIQTMGNSPLAQKLAVCLETSTSWSAAGACILSALSTREVASPTEGAHIAAIQNLITAPV
jgi:hypothetical protein